MVSDRDSEASNIAGEEQREEGSSHSVQIPLEDKPMPLAEKLINGFGAGSVNYSEVRITEPRIMETLLSTSSVGRLAIEEI